MRTIHATDPGEALPLTPVHFLIGESLVSYQITNMRHQTKVICHVGNLFKEWHNLFGSVRQNESLQFNELL